MSAWCNNLWENTGFRNGMMKSIIFLVRCLVMLAFITVRCIYGERRGRTCLDLTPTLINEFITQLKILLIYWF